MDAIKVINLSKELKENIVLKNINLTVQKATINFFYGPNGSGKTMLFRAICGMIKPSEGQVIVFGKELGKDLEFPENLGLIIENVGFWDEYTGFENLKLLASIRNVISDEEINETLEFVGLDPKDKRTYKKYSLGMKQRLAIAQAIMEKPKLLVLDEPTNSLDEDSVDRFKEIIKELKNEGVTILVSSHDKYLLDGIADNYYLMHPGGKLESVEALR